MSIGLGQRRLYIVKIIIYLCFGNDGGPHPHVYQHFSYIFIYTIHTPIPYHTRQWGNIMPNINPNTQYPIPHNTTGKFHRQTGHQTVLQSWSVMSISFQGYPKSRPVVNGLASSSSQTQRSSFLSPQKGRFRVFFWAKSIFLAKRSTFAYSMPYIFWKLCISGLK